MTRSAPILRQLGLGILLGLVPTLAEDKAVFAAENPSVSIGLIPAAVGATYLGEWPKGGAHYENARLAMSCSSISGHGPLGLGAGVN